MAEKNKRIRKQPNRYGESSENMDDLFDDIEQTTPIDKDSDYVANDEQPSDDSNSGPPEKSPIKENRSQNAHTVQTQMARIEAKLNEMFSIVVKIHRASISNVVSTEFEFENVQELPLKSDESLTKFEIDLSEQVYRQKIVSTRYSTVLFHSIYHLKCVSLYKLLQSEYIFSKLKFKIVFFSLYSNSNIVHFFVH